MEDQGLITSPEDPEKTIINHPGQTLQTPRFDAEAIQQARPAEPLTHTARRFSWSLATVAMIIGAALIGGVIGVIVPGLYPREERALAPASVPPSHPPAVEQPPVESRTAADQPDQQPTSLATSVETSSAKAVAHPSPAPVKVDSAAGQDARTKESIESTTGEPGAVTAPMSRPAASEGSAARHEAQERGHVTLHESEGNELRGAFSDWVAATNARDLEKQMSFYDQSVNAFYLTRNVSRAAVRAEKARVFGRANSVDVQASTPDIKLSRDGQTAMMRFRKRYAIADAGALKRGEVVQELRWRRTGQGWRIVSERDLRVIN